MYFSNTLDSGGSLNASRTVHSLLLPLNYQHSCNLIVYFLVSRQLEAPAGGFQGFDSKSVEAFGEREKRGEAVMERINRRRGAVRLS